MPARADTREPAPLGPDAQSTEIVDFIRHCYRRRQVSWPEIYDDMCAVVARGEFRGWRFGDLAERGVGFTIAELPRLAALVDRVVSDERGRGPDTPRDGREPGGRERGSGQVRRDGRVRPNLMTFRATRARAS
jgi:hypothetical protein